MESTKILCLSKGIFAGLWVDLESAWAFASPAVTWKRTWCDPGGIVRILLLDVLLWRLRFILILFRKIGGLFLILLFGPLFFYSSWTVQVSQSVKRTPLWLSSWLPALDKTRGSSFVDVQRV